MGEPGTRVALREGHYANRGIDMLPDALFLTLCLSALSAPAALRADPKDGEKQREEKRDEDARAGEKQGKEKERDKDRGKTKMTSGARSAGSAPTVGGMRTTTRTSTRRSAS